MKKAIVISKDTFSEDAYTKNLELKRIAADIANETANQTFPGRIKIFLIYPEYVRDMDIAKAKALMNQVLEQVNDLLITMHISGQYDLKSPPESTTSSSALYCTINFRAL